ncbi:hypothetical protein ABPG75_005249 [Micractinium tetrahymenae]
MRGGALAIQATPPRVDEDLDYSVEELQLLESWLEEHQTEGPVTIQPITSSSPWLPCGAVAGTAAAAVPHASAALDSPGTPPSHVAVRCRPSPFLADSQVEWSHGSSLTAEASSRQRNAASPSDEKFSSVLDWLSGWARLAAETETRAMGAWEDLSTLPCHQRSLAGCDVRASAQRRSMSAAAPSTAARSHPDLKRSRSCMAAPLPTAASILGGGAGCAPKRCRR